MTDDPLYLSSPRFERPQIDAEDPHAQRRRRDLRTALAATAACAAGVAIGFIAPRMMTHDVTPPAAPTSVIATPSTSSAILAAYRAPKRAHFVEAQADVDRLYDAEGLIGLKRVSEQCYARLARDAGYDQLDRCLAFDAFATRKAANAVIEPGPLAAYFQDAPARRQRMVETFIGRPDEVYPRMVAISALVVDLAGADNAVPTAPPTVAQASGDVEDTTTLAAVALHPVPIASPPVPRPEPQPRPPGVVARAYPDVDLAPPAPAPSTNRRRVAPPVERPSFDCRDLRSAAEAMICAEPELAREDRRLNAAYRYALQVAPHPRRLEREQDRWMARRDALGTDYDAVLNHYERRIDELWTGDE